MGRQDRLALDASALVESLTESQLGKAVRARLDGSDAHAPAHIDAEVLSVLGRMWRAGEHSADEVQRALVALEEMPLVRHPLPGLLHGAWAARANLRLADALYVELARSLGTRVVTTDARLAGSTALAELVEV